MKKLIVHHAGATADAMLHDGGHLERVLHEVAEAGVYQIVGIIGVGGAPAIPHFSDVSAIPDAEREGCVFFICSDTGFLNQRRLAAYMDIKRRGWPIIGLQAPSASVAEGIRLRENVFIDHTVRVLPGANIGANAWVMQGSELGANSKIGSSCWIGPHCRVSERAVLGKNCTLSDGVTIGPGVVLPDWSVINRSMTITESPTTTMFVDPLFRSPVYMFDKAVGST
jgi:hypothetical protein